MPRCLTIDLTKHLLSYFSLLTHVQLICIESPLLRSASLSFSIAIQCEHSVLFFSFLVQVFFLSPQRARRPVAAHLSHARLPLRTLNACGLGPGLLPSPHQTHTHTGRVFSRTNPFSHRAERQEKKMCWLSTHVQKWGLGRVGDPARTLRPHMQEASALTRWAGG